MGLGQDILDTEDLLTKEVKVPQWNKTVIIREMGLQESMIAFKDVEPDEAGKVTLGYMEIAQIVAFGVIDPETSDRAFSDEDVPNLARKNHKVLMLLYNAIVKLSGSVEDSVKN